MAKTQKDLYLSLEEMREAIPVTWAILVGKRTTAKIAEHLIMTPKQVEKGIQELLDQDIVKWGSYMGRPVLQIIDEDFKELADFAWRFRQKVLGKEAKGKKE